MLSAPHRMTWGQEPSDCSAAAGRAGGASTKLGVALKDHVACI